MGVNEAGRPMIHNNHAYGHDVAEAPKHPPAKKHPPKAGSAGAPNTSSTVPKTAKAALAGAPAKTRPLTRAERSDIDNALANLEKAVTGEQSDAARLELEAAVGRTLRNLVGANGNAASLDRAANRINDIYAKRHAKRAKQYQRCPYPLRYQAFRTETVVPKSRCHATKVGPWPSLRPPKGHRRQALRGASACRRDKPGHDAIVSPLETGRRRWTNMS